MCGARLMRWQLGSAHGVMHAINFEGEDDQSTDEISGAFQEQAKDFTSVVGLHP
jgi:hypothetical protein